MKNLRLRFRQKDAIPQEILDKIIEAGNLCGKRGAQTHHHSGDKQKSKCDEIAK